MENQTCRNCNSSLPDNAIYCPTCSQKNTTGKISAWIVIKEFFANHFNLESKTPRTVAHLFIPGKLTKEYFKGRHKSYIHPMQLFFVLGIILFTILGLGEKLKIADINLNQQQYKIDKQKAVFIQELDSLKKVYKKQFNDPRSSAALDSLSESMAIPEKTKADSIPMMFFFGRQIKRKDGTIITGISITDIATMTPQKVVEKYQVDRPLDKLMFQQVVKMLKNGNSFNQFLLAHVIWAIMLAIPFLALFMKLLYWQKNKFFVEHLIFGFHIHAFFFIILTLIALIGNISPQWLISILIFIIFAYFFQAMRNVYQQNIGISLLKFLFILIAYSFIFALSIIIITLVSLILF